MQGRPTEQSRPEPKKTLVVSHFAPSSFLGRIFSLLLAVAILIAALFFSLLIFWTVLTVVLFFIVYACWAFRRGYSGDSGTSTSTTAKRDKVKHRQ